MNLVCGFRGERGKASADTTQATRLGERERSERRPFFFDVTGCKESESRFLSRHHDLIDLGIPTKDVGEATAGCQSRVGGQGGLKPVRVRQQHLCRPQ